jgi:hypothetical protein
MSSPPQSGTELVTTVILGIVGVAALILSIINFYFEQLKGAEIRALAWEVSNEPPTGGKTTTIGYFAFTNEGTRTGILRAVFLKSQSGKKFPMYVRGEIGGVFEPIPLPPQETEFRVLYAEYLMTDKVPPYSYEFEMYPKRTGKIEIV